jgi:hypothetical protein
MATREVRAKLPETRNLGVILATYEMRGKLLETSNERDSMMNSLRTRNSLITGCFQQQKSWRGKILEVKRPLHFRSGHL